MLLGPAKELAHGQLAHVRGGVPATRGPLAHLWPAQQPGAAHRSPSQKAKRRWPSIAITQPAESLAGSKQRPVDCASNPSHSRLSTFFVPHTAEAHEQRLGFLSCPTTTRRVTGGDDCTGDPSDYLNPLPHLVLFFIRVRVRRG